MKRSIDLIAFGVEPLRSSDLKAQGKTFDLMIETIPEADPDVRARAIHVHTQPARAPGATIDMSVDKIGATNDVLFKAGADSLSIAAFPEDPQFLAPPPPLTLPEPIAVAKGCDLLARIQEARHASILVAFLAVVAPIFYLGHVLGFGDREVHFAVMSPFAWMRPVLLIIAAIALSLLVPEEERITAADFDVSWDGIAVAIGWGVALAFALTSPVERTSVTGAVMLGIARSASDAAFFRGYLAPRVDRAFGRPAAAVLVMTVLHAAYQLTFEQNVDNLATKEGLVRFGLFAIATSFSYALIQKKTESITAPFACQTVATIGLLVAAAH